MRLFSTERAKSTWNLHRTPIHPCIIPRTKIFINEFSYLLPRQNIYLQKRTQDIMYECPLFPQTHNLDEDLNQHHDEDE